MYTTFNKINQIYVFSVYGRQLDNKNDNKKMSLS